MKIVEVGLLLLFGVGVVRINAQDSDDVDDESYSVQMDHKEMHSTPIEGTFVKRRRRFYNSREMFFMTNL